LGISKTTIKSNYPILLTVVTLLETHCFLPIKILMLKIKSIKKKIQGWPNHPIGGGRATPVKKNKNKKNGWLSHPHGPRGGSATLVFFFFFNRFNFLN
jgi:hypothetical protein